MKKQDTPISKDAAFLLRDLAKPFGKQTFTKVLTFERFKIALDELKADGLVGFTRNGHVYLR